MHMNIIIKSNEGKKARRLHLLLHFELKFHTSYLVSWYFVIVHTPVSAVYSLWVWHILSGVSCNCGSCTDLLGAFRCDCDPWTTGRYCETDIDECANKSQCSVDKRQGICQNINITKETCDNRKKGAECYCTPGFTGIVVCFRFFRSGLSCSKAD